MAIKINPKVKNKIQQLGVEDMGACYSCGTCIAICPVNENLLPRVIFKHALLGSHKKLIEDKEIIFSCLLCKLCESSCPRGVSIAENIRLLRYYINQEVFKI